MSKDNRKELFLKHLSDAKGIITYACQQTGISRRTFYNWKENDEEFAQAVEDISEMAIDIAESKLLTAIADDNLTAIIFYLKTKGRKRGYVEQVDQNLNVNPFEQLMKSLPDEPDE